VEGPSPTPASTAGAGGGGESPAPPEALGPPSPRALSRSAATDSPVPPLRSGIDETYFNARPISRSASVRGLGANSNMPPKIGYFELEVNAPLKEKSLQIYGESWECLENSKLWGSVTEILFKFVSVERIVEKAMPYINVRAKSFSPGSRYQALTQWGWVAAIREAGTSAVLPEQPFVAGSAATSH
jgi:hypothetical protein